MACKPTIAEDDTVVQAL